MSIAFPSGWSSVWYRRSDTRDAYKSEQLVAHSYLIVLRKCRGAFTACELYASRPKFVFYELPINFLPATGWTACLSSGPFHFARLFDNYRRARDFGTVLPERSFQGIPGIPPYFPTIHLAFYQLSLDFILAIGQMAGLSFGSLNFLGFFHEYTRLRDFWRSW